MEMASTAMEIPLMIVPPVILMNDAKITNHCIVPPGENSKGDIIFTKQIFQIAWYEKN